MKCTLTCLCLLLAGTAGRAATRIALVSPRGSESVQSILALAEVKLSAEPGIQLLERQAIDRVLAEQKLALAGLVGAEQAVAAGKLLGVELFAVVETAPDGREALDLVVFEAASGVRLADAPLPSGAGTRVAEAVAAGVRAAVRKHEAGLRNLRTVCLLGVRNADLPPSATSFAEFVALLLERRLAASPGVAVLERQRLDYVNRERSLTPVEKQLQAAVILVQLELRRLPGESGLQATALLTDSSGKLLQRIPTTARQIRDADAAILADPLARAILAYLRTAPAPRAPDPRAEGNRFLREAQLMWSHRQLLRGLQGAESAQALDPDDPDSQAVLAQYLLSYAVYLLHPEGIFTIYYGDYHLHVEPDTLKTSLELAQRALDIRLGTFRRLQPRDRRTLVRDWVRHLRAEAALRSYVNKLHYLDPASFDADTRDQRETFRTTLDGLLHADFDAWAELALAHPRPLAVPPGITPPDSVFASYSNEIRARWEILGWNAPSASTYLHTVLPIVRRWLDVAAHQDPNTIQIGHLSWFLEELTRNLTRPPFAGWKLGPKEYAQVAQVFRAFEEHPYPLIQLYGRGGRLLVGLMTRKLTVADAARQFGPVQEQAFAWIRMPPVGGADAFRLGCYKFLAHTLPRLIGEANGLFLDPTAGKDPAALARVRGPLVEDLYAVADFMLARREIVPDVITAVAYDGGSTPADLRKRLDRIDRVLAGLDAPGFRLLDGVPGAVRSSLLSAREQLVQFHPELAPKSAGAPWQDVRTLLDLRAKPGGPLVLAAATLANGHVYVVGGSPRGRQSVMQLIDVPLGDGEPRWRGEASLTLPANLLLGTFGLTVTGCCVHGGRAYVGTRTDGIFVFDLNGGPGQRIGTGEGLPANAVTALAFAAGRLYAALEGGYLVAVSLSPLRVDVLASSRRKERASPFDDCPRPFRVPYLVADPERRRILFVLYTGMPSTANTTDGLWELDPATRAFRQRLGFTPEANISWGSRVRDSRLLLASPALVLAYDLARDNPYVIAASAVVRGLAPDVHRFPGASPPDLLRGGWLWTSYPFGRIRVATGHQETLPSPAGQKGPVPFAASCLEPVGDGRLLIGDSSGLWLVTLRKGE